MIAERQDAPLRMVAAGLWQLLQMTQLFPLMVWINQWWVGRSVTHRRAE